MAGRGVFCCRRSEYKTDVKKIQKLVLLLYTGIWKYQSSYDASAYVIATDDHKGRNM